jgi:hypothetical protein
VTCLKRNPLEALGKLGKFLHQDLPSCYPDLSSGMEDFWRSMSDAEKKGVSCLFVVRSQRGTARRYAEKVLVFIRSANCSSKNKAIPSCVASYSRGFERWKSLTKHIASAGSRTASTPRLSRYSLSLKHWKKGRFALSSAAVGVRLTREYMKLRNIFIAVAAIFLSACVPMKIYSTPQADGVVVDAVTGIVTRRCHDNIQ